MIQKPFGASCRGNHHIRTNKPNQDNFLVKYDHKKQVSIAIVSDGLGSKEYSKWGSQMLCKVVLRLVMKQFKQNEFKLNVLLEKIKKKWHSKVKPYPSSECDATCLFVLVSEQSMIIAQLGDGLIRVHKDNQVVFETQKTDAFANITKSINKSKLSDWVINVMDISAQSTYELFIATDGISETIIQEKAAEFFNQLSRNLLQTNDKKRYLYNVLTQWPKSASIDDRTLVVML